MRKIPLTQGKYALVDEKDYKYLCQWKWFCDNGYAVRQKYVGGKRYKQKKIHIHRVILKTPNGMDTDHINGNRSDNRKSNLRIASRSQNCINKNRSKGSRGICFNQLSKKWKAYIRVNGKNTHLGYFKTKTLAQNAYDESALKHYGQFAVLNRKKHK